MINGVRVQLYPVVVARADRELDYGELQRRLETTTGARGTPDVDLSLSNIFSALMFIGAGQLPYRTYSAPGFRRGYILAPLNSNIAVIGTWAASNDIPSNPLRKAVSLTIRHVGPLTLIDTLMMKGATLLTLLWLLLPTIAVAMASDIPELVNTYVPMSTFLGKVAIFGLLPCSMLAVAYLVLITWGYSTVPIFFAALAVVAVLRTLKHAVSFAGLKETAFNLYFDEHPPLFQVFTLNHREAEVNDIPVVSSHFARFVLWSPHKQHCQKCGTKYVIHTASKAEAAITKSEYEARDIGDDKTVALAREAASKARAPVNGCPQCGSRTGEVIAAEKHLRSTLRVGRPLAKIVGGALTFIVGALLWLLLDKWEPPKSVAPIVDAVGEVVVGIAILVPLGIVIYGLYDLIVYLSTQYISRSSSFVRIWACRSDGLLFEDPELVAEPSGCLKCNKHLVPFRNKLGT